ncbi:MAG: proton-conducting transporter membrane subunit [Coriobacteriia bacterium]|nr:proton-conducting transporter membrane subunit [Coriobacteriia bacterium]
MSEALIVQLPALCIVTLLFAAPIAFVVSARGARVVSVLTAVLETALAIALAVAVASRGELRYEIGGWGAPLGIDLVVDGISAVLILLTSVVALGVTIYSVAYFGSDERYRLFWPLWLFLWGSLTALFSTNDAFNLYVCLELVSVSAVALVSVAGSRSALTAAMRYMLAAVGGSLFYLLGVAMLYGAFGVLDLDALSTVAGNSPAGLVGLALIVTGLVLKTALVPLHFWLPPAHANAPAPVSAVLSALVVKGSFYVLLSIIGVFSVSGAADALSTALGVLGAVAIVWGSVHALMQSRLKMLVAYSTVAQIGYLFILFGVTAASGGTAPAATAITAGVFHAVSHALAKSAMFLVAGTVLVRAGHDRIADLTGLVRTAPALVLAFGVAGVSMLGLPPSGGFVSKWLYVSAALGSTAWWWAIPVLIGGLLAGAYVFRVVGVFMRAPVGEAVVLQSAPAALTWVPLALAFASLFVGVLGQPVLDLIGPAAASLAGVGR